MHTAVKPQLYVLARTVWFFAIFVTTGAFRWLVGEWRRAAARANAIRPL
jgi:hypothetical protein